jgi:hypothetical protein
VCLTAAVFVLELPELRFRNGKYPWSGDLKVILTRVVDPGRSTLGPLYEEGVVLIGAYGG